MTAVLAPKGARVARDALEPAARCLLNPYALGRFSDAEYTFYRVVR